ncbi:lipopolysaccharide kinase InaA family protein [Geodermatophilus sp. SYSU D00691]
MGVAGLGELPWHLPLERWPADRLVPVPGVGLSRHVVRFAAGGDGVVALKEIPERVARRELRLLAQIGDRGLPAVEGLGVVADRPGDLDAVLLTRFLDGSSSLRAVLAAPATAAEAGELLAALARLLVVLHRAGVLWGDCSLSNTLVRREAGSAVLHLVDAETAEVHERLSRGQREHDLEVALGRVAGELLDLRAGGLLSPEVDPFAAAEDLVARYRSHRDGGDAVREITGR